MTNSAKSIGPILEARAVVRTLGDKIKTTVLHGIDVGIDRGEFVALTGHSGSGKSTLLYVLGILDRPTSGDVLIDGISTGDLDDDARSAIRNSKLGFVFQFHFLLADFSVVENVMIPMKRRGLADAACRRQAEDTLASLGLADLAKRRPNELSGGQQQRVSIARALANDPVLLLADEPTGNLDSTNGEIVMNLFRELNTQRSLTIVMVTHDDEFAASASRRLVLKDGVLIADERRPRDTSVVR